MRFTRGFFWTGIGTGYFWMHDSTAPRLYISGKDRIPIAWGEVNDNR
jgi:hypothetical protein